MRVTNDADEGGGGSSPFGELLRLQTDFQARLAEETLRYLRRLQGTVGPAAPGTIVLPEDGLVLRCEAVPGGQAHLRVEIENLQRVHCMVSPRLTPLVGRSGTTWFPATEPPFPSLLIPPGVAETLVLDIAVPTELPFDLYTGALLLQGFRRSALAVSVTVHEVKPASGRPASGKRRRQSAARPAPDEGVTDEGTAGQATGLTDAGAAPKKSRSTGRRGRQGS